jgi:MFS family permease
MTSSVAVRGNACFEWFRRFLAELWRETKHPFMSDPDQVVDQDKPDRRIVVTALGVTQILAWGSTFYLLGVLANPIVRDTGWDYDWVISGVSAGLLMAGVVSPRVGRAIGKWGGRRALALSTVLLAAGLLLLGASRSIPWYLAAWLLVGAGMGSGLTDAAFSTLGSIYGDDARSPITSLTLFAGFASTVSWPLSAYLVEHLGWRGACFFAAIQIGVALPILLLALPRHSFIAPPRDDDEGARSYARLAPGELSIFALLAVVLTLSAAILSMVGVHLLPLLQARGLELSAAVGLGAIVGPSQVGARIVEMLAGRRYHPIWTMVASAVLVAIGTELLYADFPAYSVAYRAVWCREWPWICRSGHSGARAVWIVPVPDADGAPCAADSNVDGAISIPGSDCL